MIVLDASVVLKWILRDEPGTPDALEFREHHRSGAEPVAVPDLLFYEVANVMVSSGRLAREQAEESWAGLVALHLSVYPVHTPVILRAMELARAARVPVYDAVYVALAEALQCGMVTADARMANKLRGHVLGCALRVL